MSKFKTGDRVLFLNSDYNSPFLRAGDRGTVQDTVGDGACVLPDDRPQGDDFAYYFDDHEMVRIIGETPTMRVGDKVVIVSDEHGYSCPELRKGNMGTLVKKTTWYGEPGFMVELDSGFVGGFGWNFAESHLRVLK